MSQSRMAGFTLIELLVVIAIVAMLASIIFPVYSKAKEKSYQTVCLNNQRQVGIAITMVAQDNDEIFPGTDTVWQDIELRDDKILNCPTYDEKGINTYAYSSFIADLAIGSFKDPTSEMMVVDSTLKSDVDPNTFINPGDIAYRHNGGAITCYLDGHCGLIYEPPPLWTYNLTNATEFQDLLESGSSFPIMLFFTTDSSTAPDEVKFCEVIDDNVDHLAMEYRSRVVFATIGDDAIGYEDLADQYEVVPGDSTSGCPAFRFFKNEAELDSHRVSGFPSEDTSAWTDDQWEAEATERINEVKSKLDGI